MRRINPWGPQSPSGSPRNPPRPPARTVADTSSARSRSGPEAQAAPSSRRARLQLELQSAPPRTRTGRPNHSGQAQNSRTASARHEGFHQVHQVHAQTRSKRGMTLPPSPAVEQPVPLHSKDGIARELLTAQKQKPRILIKRASSQDLEVQGVPSSHEHGPLSRRIDGEVIEAQLSISVRRLLQKAATPTTTGPQQQAAQPATADTGLPVAPHAPTVRASTSTRWAQVAASVRRGQTRQHIARGAAYKLLQARKGAAKGGAYPSTRHSEMPVAVACSPPGGEPDVAAARAPTAPPAAGQPHTTATAPAALHSAVLRSLSSGFARPAAAAARGRSKGGKRGKGGKRARSYKRLPSGASAGGVAVAARQDIDIATRVRK